jgi:predicted ferric reductase
MPLFRRPSYELFLRTHQVWAVLSAYSIWRHLSSMSDSRLYLYIAAGLFFLMCMAQIGMVIHQNGVFYYGCARARMTHEYGAIRVHIHLQRPVKVKAGQAINLWIPSVSFWSFLQSHPFVVISWSATPQHDLDLFIEPRRGLTRELLYHAKNGHAMNPLVLFSGPHGKSVSMDDCQNILMIASDFGIAAHLPYLKQLIDGYNSRKVRARRIHLVWQVRDIGKLWFHFGGED